jgi:LCP family protein required for cell wall assembly
LLLALLILLFAGGAAYGALILVTRVDSILLGGRNISIPIPVPGVEQGNTSDSVGGNRMNVLILGLDRRPNEGDIYTRTDTMIVATIDPQSRTAGMLGIPRDLYVKIPNEDGGYFEERINTALEYGQLYNYPGGGIKLAEDTIEKNLGIHIDHYVIIDFQGFEEVIDSLGGIDVDVPDYVYDPTYSETEKPGDYFPLEFFPGVQHMDGETALGYARTRYNSSDLDRIQRQQRVIFAVMDKMTSLDVLPHALDLWDKYKHTIDTDVSEIKVPTYASLAMNIPPNRISALSLGPCTTGWMTPSGMSVLMPSEEGCKEIVDALFLDQQLMAENATVEVRDGTGEDLTGATVKLLINLGFPEASVIASSAPDEGLVTETEIVDYSGKSISSGKIAEWLGVPETAVRAATPADADLRTGRADIVVVLGSDAKVTGLSSDSTDSESSQ